MDNRYSFPETNVFRAREVLSSDFDIDKFNKDLYVDIDNIRIISEESDYKNNLFFNLNINIENHKLETRPNDFKKILFLGHRGCGKTMELRRIHKYLHDKSRYFSIFIETEKELEIGSLHAEDFFIIMVVKIIRKLKENDIDTDYFDEILKDWLNDIEVQEEITKGKSIEGSASLKIDTDNLLMKALSFFKFETEIKGTLSSENKTTKTIRSKIKSNLMDFSIKFNDAIAQTRNLIQEKNLGKDLIFVIDGTEKSSFEFYENLFQNNGHVLRSLDVNLITTIRLDAFYKLENKPNLDFYEQVFVPMVSININNQELFEKIITQRVSKDLFFDTDALNLIVEYSGGSIRQLLKIANQALLFSRGKKVDKERAEKTIKTEGDYLYHALSPEQKEILKNNTWIDNWSHLEVSTMLFAMALLKYNGKADINPLIKNHFS